MKHTDKILHFSVSFLIASVLDAFMILWLAALITFLVGLAKEFYDEHTYGGFSILDLGADIAGILLYCIKVLLL